ncbi:helix-turn-helix transcriptional regulator [Tritonibacter horizontis]|uniref:helix-turn-helix transcriptional regulator n=1 Tax=Tritonibacter horizontis TaxID=1768241 RepID=UPI002FC38224
MLELKPRKSQAEIAADAGFTNPNVVSMIKSGASKLPLDRVPSMAKALECDPAYLLRLAMEQTVGDTAAQAILDILGTPVSENETGWLVAIRDASGNTDPRLTSRGQAAIKGIFGK